MLPTLKKIIVVDNGLVLKFKNKESKEIAFSEINKVYLKVKKTPIKYILLFVAVSLSAVLCSLLIFGFKLILFSPLLLILLGVIKLNAYRRYALKIKLKNGIAVVEPISSKIKYDTIEDIKKIRKGIKTKKA